MYSSEDFEKFSIPDRGFASWRISPIIWLSEEHKLRKSAERKIKALQEKLDYAN